MSKPSKHPILDYFVHTKLTENQDLHHRARILSAVLLIFSTVLLLASIAWLVAPIASLQRWVAFSITSSLMLGLSYLLIQLRASGNYSQTCMTGVVLVFMGIFVGIAVSGGVGSSPASQLLVIPAMMAYFFGGIRWGNIVSLATFSLMLLMLALGAMGLQAPQTLDPNIHRLSSVLVVCVGFFAVLGMVFIYELTTRTLTEERDEEHSKVLHMAQTDPLTELNNRRSFDETLIARMQDYKTHKREDVFVLCYMDLDGFKPINDRYGHDAGDEVLKALSMRLRNILRDSDSIARHGGDEFMLMLDPVPDRKALQTMAVRILRTIEQPIKTADATVDVSASMGFAFYPDHAGSVNELKQAADAAMYEAKRNRMGWRVYEPHMLPGKQVDLDLKPSGNKDTWRPA